MAGLSADDFRHWGATLGLVLMPPIAAYTLARFPHAKWSLQGRPSAATPTRAEGDRTGGGPHCLWVEPGYFLIEPGGSQILRAHFSGEAGSTDFAWTATAGSLRVPGAEPGESGLRGRIVADPLTGPLDVALWDVSAPKAATVAQNRDGLSVTLPGGEQGAGDTSLRGRFPVAGDFVAEVTVASLTADGPFAGATLELDTVDEFSIHVQRSAAQDFIAVETNARWRQEPWLGSTTHFDTVGPRRLRLRREGTHVTADYTVDGREVPLGTGAREGASAEGHVELRTWSVANLPRVTAVYRDLVVRQGDEVIFRAPPGAANGDLLAIRAGDDCAATAKIFTIVERPR